MTPLQIDAFECAVLIADSNQIVNIFLAGMQMPLSGLYQRLDNDTIILHTGRSGQWFIDISNIAAIGVRT
jgi:hypothetical protein